MNTNKPLNLRIEGRQNFLGELFVPSKRVAVRMGTHSFLIRSGIVILYMLVCSVGSATTPLSHEAALQRFPTTVKEIEQKRKTLLRRYKRAHSPNEKKAIYKEAEAYITDRFYTHIAPAWLGMPWTMAVIDDGLKPDARVPHEAGKGVSCSWFVVALLENIGIRFGNPRGFAGTIAVHLQRSLSPQKKDFKRLFNVSPEQLKNRLIKWGDGLYIIGLNCHIGFVHVKGDQVRFIHSDYTDPMKVTIEPITASDAIDMSADAGYVVSALFKDNRLIHKWLTGSKVFFKGPKK